ncbi:MAG TPA: PhzF family phenazine biosynthesis protein, partial [Hellea balneolensis]|nr:PhzF family phenazine biosynthesis protein [Hellea balneolensis]
MRKYVILDVFTNQPLAGNPLAVVLDTQRLAAADMQAIAKEFNLSETVFVLPAQRDDHRASLRIFTPRRELPFAGHPTIGTAILLAHLDHLADGQEVSFVLQEKVGDIPCTVSREKEAYFATFPLPITPRFEAVELDQDL